jgi:PKD repeat protein
MQRTIIPLCNFLPIAVLANAGLIFCFGHQSKKILLRHTLLKKIIACCFLTLVFAPKGFSQTPKVDFTMSKNEDCVPFTVIFTDISTGGGGVVSRSWYLGYFLSTQTDATVGANFHTAGTYTITLTVRFANGVIDSAKKNLVVHPVPVANFTTVDSVGCSPLTARFKDLSTTATGTITEWFWDLDVTTSNLQNPTQQYTRIDNYKITLYVKNSWGCKSELAVKDDYIRVIDRPVVNFTLAPQNTCSDTLTVFMTNTSLNAPGYLWTFGDKDTSTQANPSHFYTQPGSYQVKLRSIVAPGCGDSTTKTVNMGTPNATIISSPDTVCENTSYSFAGSAAPSSSCKWLFNADSRSGCTVSYAFPNPGLYEILFIGFNSWGCADTARKNILVKASPQPVFTIDTARSCKWPFTVQAINLTQDRSLKFTWNFGDSPLSIVAVDPPPHTYNLFGNFTITLTAEDTVTGCKTTIVKRDTIRIVQPTVALTRSPVTNCLPPKPYSFTATPNFSVDPVIKYIWTFGDNNTDTTTSPTTSHTYTASGTFTVTVTALSKNGCSAFNSTSVTLFDTCVIPPRPQPVIFATYNCNTCNEVTLRDTVSNSTIISWDMGYNNVILSTNSSTITHLFPMQPGSYTVTLTRRNNFTGDTSRTNVTIKIYCLAPVFTISKKIACIGDSIHFTPAGLDSSLVSFYRWTANNNTIGTVNNTSQPPYRKGEIYYGFNQLGTYVIRLIVTDGRGCTIASQTDTILVQGPRPDFRAQPRTSCDTAFTVFFNDSTTLNAGIPIVKWQWSFGDNTFYTTTRDTMLSRRYRGTTIPLTQYNVSLTVTDSVGCTNSITKNSFVKLYRPRAAFSSRDTVQCNRFAVGFSNSSQAIGATHTWHFGDGVVANGVNPSHLYPQGDGEYDVTLIIKDENGCVDSIQKSKYIKFVHPKAIMSIRDTGQCWPVQLRFCDSSLYASSYVWKFGEGADQSIACPKKNYASPGTYMITLIVTGPNGCRDTTSQQIKVKGAKGELQQGPLTGCQPFTAMMTAVKNVNIDSFAWDWNDGSVVIPTKVDSIATHLYAKAGKYLPNIIIVSSEGCRYSIKAKDPFIVDSAKALFSATPLLSCSKDSVRVTNLSAVPDFSLITKHTWDWGDGKTSSVANPVQHLYDSSGIYIIQLAIESKYGCKDTFRLPEPVKIFSPPQLFIAGKDSACQKSTLNFTSQVQSYDSVKTIQWLFNGAVAGTDTTFILRFDTTGIFPVTLNVSTRYGCDATLTKPVVIFPVPVPKASPDTTICINSTLRLRAYDGGKYLWAPATTLNDATTATPIARPAVGTTNYVVTVTNGFGCEAKDTATVKVDDSLHLRTVSPVEVCRGDSITLQANANTNRFLWSPVNGLQNAASSNPVASPVDTTLYSVIGFSNNTCPNDTNYVQVNVNPLPQVKAKANPLKTTPGSEVVLAATSSADVVKYSWMPASLLLNAGSDIAYWQYPDTSTTFRITVQNRAGCIATDVVHIEVVCANSSVVVPSAFTPGGKNPYFRPSGLFKSDPKLKYFRVYNRWGQLVYQVVNRKTSEITGWDGKVNGVIQGSAVFVWILEVECLEGTVAKKGTVALVR